jgi:hypothetical protein
VIAFVRKTSGTHTTTNADTSEDSEDGHPCNDIMMAEPFPWHQDTQECAEYGDHQLLAVDSVAAEGITEDTDWVDVSL